MYVVALPLMLGGVSPPREVLPGAMSRLNDVVLLTYAGRVLGAPWVGQPWDLATWGLMVMLLLLSLSLAWWRLATEDA